MPPPKSAAQPKAPKPPAGKAAQAAKTVRAQQRLDEVQSLYREWLTLHDRLQAAQADWRRARTVMDKLGRFYFDGEYRKLCDALENGLPLNLHTPGEYSVLGEDTIWNAFHDQQQMAWQWMRAAIGVLDRDGENAAGMADAGAEDESGMHGTGRKAADGG